eukprot:4506716-Pleurochrysis_carterae.AAC.1
MTTDIRGRLHEELFATPVARLQNGLFLTFLPSGRGGLAGTRVNPSKLPESVVGKTSASYYCNFWATGLGSHAQWQRIKQYKTQIMWVPYLVATASIIAPKATLIDMLGP